MLLEVKVITCAGRNANQCNAGIVMLLRDSPDALRTEGLIVEQHAGAEGLWWWGRSTVIHPGKVLENALASIDHYLSEMMLAMRTVEQEGIQAQRLDAYTWETHRWVGYEQMTVDMCRALALGSHAGHRGVIPGRLCVMSPCLQGEPVPEDPACDPRVWQETDGYAAGHVRPFPFRERDAWAWDDELARFLAAPDSVEGLWRHPFFKHVAIPIRSARISADRGAPLQAQWQALDASPRDAEWVGKIDWIAWTRIWIRGESQRMKVN